MFDKIELLSKQEHQGLYFTAPDDFSYASSLRFAPLALSEVAGVARNLPVMISGGDEQEFVVLMSVSDDANFFAKYWQMGSGIDVPAFIKHYPFTMVNAQQEGSDRLMRAVGVDVESPAVSDSGDFLIMGEGGEPSPEVKEKLKRLQRFEQERVAAHQLVLELKKHELLDKRSIDVKIGEESKTLLKDFFVVNRSRIYELPASLIVEWVKRGWMFAIESHIQSIEHVQLLLSSKLKEGSKLTQH